VNRKLFLVGLPGAGKTTMGLDLSVDLGIPFVDLDQEIEKENKSTIREIFREQGEAQFRQLEKLHLSKVITEMDEFVMATGGGTPCFFDNLEQMRKHGQTVFVHTPTEVINERLKKDTSRPLMQEHSLEELYEKRKEWYSQADHTIQEYEELLKLFRSSDQR